MVKEVQNSVKVIRDAATDSLINLDEFRNIQEAVLVDEKVDDAEAQALGSLLATSSFETIYADNLGRIFLSSLAESRDASTYLSYNFTFWNETQLNPQRVFWTYQNSGLGAKIDANEDGALSVEDLFYYKHPSLEEKPDCSERHSIHKNLPFDFNYPQWTSLVFFLRTKILEGPESLQSVREFMMLTYHEDPARFEYLLNSFNVHLEPSFNSKLAALAVEASLARVIGNADFSTIFNIPLNSNDLEIPLFIRPRAEDEPQEWAAQTSTGIINGGYRVFITLFSDQETLREKFQVVQHEMRHALFNKLRGEERFNLPLLIREPLANYWDEGDGRKELRNYLANADLAFTPHLIHQIYEKLESGDSNGVVLDEHFEGNILFYFFERHYGREGLRRFCHNLLPEIDDKEDDSLLEKASQAMAGKAWSEVLEDFKGDAAHYLKELKNEEGGAQYQKLIQDYFNLPWVDWFYGNKVNELRQLSSQARSELKKELIDLLERYPDSPYIGQCSYLMGQIEMFEGNFSEARNFFLQVTGHQSAISFYGIIWSYVMEGKVDLALQFIHLNEEVNAETSLFSDILEDIYKNQGEGLRAQYFKFYGNTQEGEISYFLGEK